MAEALRRHDFDTVLMALNAAPSRSAWKTFLQTHDDSVPA